MTDNKQLEGARERQLVAEVAALRVVLQNVVDCAVTDSDHCPMCSGDASNHVQGCAIQYAEQLLREVTVTPRAPDMRHLPGCVCNECEEARAEARAPEPPRKESTMVTSVTSEMVDRAVTVYAERFDPGNSGDPNKVDHYKAMFYAIQAALEPPADAPKPDTLLEEYGKYHRAWDRDDQDMRSPAQVAADFARTELASVERARNDAWRLVDCYRKELSDTQVKLEEAYEFRAVEIGLRMATEHELAEDRRKVEEWRKALIERWQRLNSGYPLEESKITALLQHGPWGEE